MKIKWKKILIVIAVIVIVYVVFVFIDCNRLRNSAMYTKPLICVSEQNYDNTVVYKGLGYSIKYSQYKEIDERDGIAYIQEMGDEAEFSLFGITIWSWKE